MLTLLALTDPEVARAHGISPAQQARLRALFEEHYDIVWRVLRRNGLPHAQADDGAQQVFLVALNRLKDMDAGKERAFLCATAVHVARRMRQGQPREELQDELPETEGGARPDEVSEKKAQRALLDALLLKLDEDLRQVFVLQEVEGLSKREAAVALGIPEGTVASRLRRAKESFAALLRQHLEGRAP